MPECPDSLRLFRTQVSPLWRSCTPEHVHLRCILDNLFLRLLVPFDNWLVCLSFPSLCSFSPSFFSPIYFQFPVHQIEFFPPPLTLLCFFGLALACYVRLSFRVSFIHLFSLSRCTVIFTNPLFFHLWGGVFLDGHSPAPVSYTRKRPWLSGFWPWYTKYTESLNKKKKKKKRQAQGSKKKN